MTIPLTVCRDSRVAMMSALAGRPCAAHTSSAPSCSSRARTRPARPPTAGSCCPASAGSTRTRAPPSSATRSLRTVRRYVDAVLEQRRGHHGDPAPAIMAFSTSSRGVDAAGDRQVGPDVAVEDRHPVQAQRAARAGSTGSGRAPPRALQVEVRLVEAVEQDQAVRADARPSRRATLANAAEDGPSLTATGIDTLAFTSRTRSMYICSTSAPRQRRIGRHVVDVQLQRVGAGLLDLLANSIQPPVDTPFRLAMIGISTAAFARRTCSR